MALIQVCCISFAIENEVCGITWWHFHNNIAKKQNIVTDIELIFGQLVTHDKMKPVYSVAMLIL